MTQPTSTEPTPEMPAPLDPRRLRRWGLVAAAAAVAIVAGGLASRVHSAHSAAQWSQAQATPSVTLARLQPVSASTLVLPGAVQPFQVAQVYARVSGYLKSWRRDIGAPVKAGELLAEIDAPDLDQQLQQAQADLNTAKANQRLSAVTEKRWTALLQQQYVSQQLADEKIADLQAKTAISDSYAANVKRLEAMSAFKRVVAPFDGVVTARKTDVGALINAGSSGLELFEVADLHRVRIYVQAPQALSAQLAPGQTASLEMPQFPGKPFTATITAVSHMFDATSKTMQVELQADNPGNVLAAGSYAQVRFAVPGAPGAVRVPASALITDASGVKVAILGPDSRVHMRKVQVARDLGDAVEVSSGLSVTDRVIDSPPETIADGAAVALAAPKAAGKSA